MHWRTVKATKLVLLNKLNKIYVYRNQNTNFLAAVANGAIILNYFGISSPENSNISLQKPLIN